MSEQPETNCSRCWIGDLHLSTGIFSLLHDGQLISIPHAPTRQCDICGYQEWDEGFMNWVEDIFGEIDAPGADDSLPRTGPTSPDDVRPKRTKR